jgi:hypothetical protein
MQFVAKHSNQSRLAFIATLLILIAVSLLPASTVAHDAGTFTINIRPDKLQPDNTTLVMNDTALWRNVDSSDNMTHRIVWDSDGDGLYNGTLDWDSGNLTKECELDEYGARVDSDCKVVFEISFNSTWGAGTYIYQDLLSNGTVNNGTIIVLSDNHTTDSNAPPPGGYEFGNGEENQELQSDENEEERNWLLWLAGASGLLSILLIGLLLVMRTNDSLVSKDEEIEDKSGGMNSDSDINEIAEEE